MEIITENVELKDKQVNEIKVVNKEIKSERSSNRIAPSPMIDSISTLHPVERQIYNASGTSSHLFPAINEEEQLYSKRKVLSNMEDPYSPKSLENTDGFVD